jgi:hypothetical protein
LHSVSRMTFLSWFQAWNETELLRNPPGKHICAIRFSKKRPLGSAVS